MYGVSATHKKSIQLLLSVVILFSLVFDSGVAVAASTTYAAGESEDCPESLLLKGKELFEQIPEISAQFPGESNPETEPSEQSWFAPRLPNWLEVSNWSLPSFGAESARNEGDSSNTDQQQELLEESLETSQFESGKWVEKAEALLKSHGFEDTDGDGNLNWPEDSPVVGGQNLDIVVVVTESSGVIIGFVPIVGDAVDAGALVIAKDPITGECLSKTDQLLLALSLLLVIPVSAKTLKLVGGFLSKSEIDMPIVWRTLQGTLKKLDFETHTWFVKLDEGFEWTFRNVRNVNRLNRVALKYWRFRTIAGRGATTSGELAPKLGFTSFTGSNYREALLELTGRKRDEVAGLEAHHILPQEFLQEFQEIGFEAIHDPRLLVWVDPSDHRRWSSDYSKAWRSFLEQNPDASKMEVLKKARDLSEEFGYDVLFRTSSWNPLRQLSWPF